MAKTESTAVNDLIQIAATQRPLPADPSEDLMFAIPSKKDRNPKLSARGTAQVAPLPLPRDRAPHSTEEHAIAMPAIKIATTRSTQVPPLPPTATRTTTLPPGSALAPPPTQVARTKTPPPLPTSSAAIVVAPPIGAATLEPRNEPSIDPAAAEPIATRATRPSLPPPTRAPLPPPSRAALPSEYPIVSAVHSLPLAPAPVARVRTQTPWAEDDVDVDVDGDVSMPFHGDSTAQLAKPRTNLEWIVKLAPWMGVMVVLGVFVGGYIVFDGQGGKQGATAPSVEVKAVADDSPVIAAPAAEPPPVVPAPSAAEPAPAVLAAAVTPPNLAATPTAAVPAVPSTTTSPTTTTAPATPSIATPAPTPTAIATRPVFVDVRIDSKPAGATVMLVDRGKQTFLGTTPISTAVDPTRGYDVVFAYPNRQTQIEHLDPKATARLSVVLGTPGNRATPELAKPAAVARLATTTATLPTDAAPAKVVKVAKAAKAGKIVEPAWEASAPVATTTAVATTETRVKVTRPEARATKLEAAPATGAKTEEAVGGDGVLMISSKPPCEIHVDGKATGLMTPQRALPLSAGKHRITLVHPTEKIRKSFAVEITANASTKVIQDLMK